MMNSDDKRLLEASASGQTDQVLQLIEEHGHQLHKFKDQDGRTALHLAATNGHSETVSALIMNGAEISAQDLTGHTALQKASAEGHFEVVKQLISRGCLIDHQDDIHGNTALHEAAWKGFSRSVEILCKNKSNYYLRNRGGFSALHLCCQNGHNESCRVLLRAGCKPNIKNTYGDTPLHTAARYGHAGVARIILSGSANPNLQNKNGDTPLHIAAAMGRRKLVRILLESPLLDLNIPNQQQEKAVDIATRKNHDEVVTMLRHPPQVKKTTTTNIASTEVIKAEINNITHDSEDSKKKNNTNTMNSKSGKSSRSKSKCSASKLMPGLNDPKWSPYGCHYYPDMTEFPEPNVESLPNEPLKSGEQYFLDLAGNIKKGPTGHGSTCYCAPFIHRFEQKLDKNKKEIVKHLENKHGKLANRINYLERKTRDQISGMSNNIKENLAQERLECQDRMERRAIRDFVAIDRSQGLKHSILKQDLTSWLDSRMKSLEESASKNKSEHSALLRTLLRGSKRRKRALRSELNSGSFRRALSEDEQEDDPDDHDPADQHVLEDLDLIMSGSCGYGLGLHHNPAESGIMPHAQSEYNFPITSCSSTLVPSTDFLQERLRGLHVSDHPRMTNDDAVMLRSDPNNENSNNNSNNDSPKPEVRVRRSSAGDETMLFCDFGDFNTQELISSPVDFESNNNNNRDDNGGAGGIMVAASGGSGLNSLEGHALLSTDYLSYSTQSESATSSHTLLQRPIPYSPAPQIRASLNQLQPPSNNFYQNMSFGGPGPLLRPPMLPPKSHIPPPYRPPPHNQQAGGPLPPGPLQPPFLNGPRPHFDEEHFSKMGLPTHPHHHHALMGGAFSSSDGGSHDSHNDSGYCAVRGSGGPSPSLSGSQGRPDSRGPAFEVNEPSPPNTHISQPPVLKAALGPVISNGLSVAPRIRQLQMQISNNPPTTNNNNPTCAPRGSLV